MNWAICPQNQCSGGVGGNLECTRTKAVKFHMTQAVADPGFAVGVARVRWELDLLHGHFSQKVCAKMKELGVLGELGDLPMSSMTLSWFGKLVTAIHFTV